MRTLLVTSLVVLLACGDKKSAPPAETGSPQAPAQAEAPPPPPADAASAEPATDDDGRAEVAQLVVSAVGSKALGSQTIDPGCVTVVTMPAGEWTVAAAWLKDCGDKTARSLIWVYKRKNGPWNEDYAGTPPKCWKGVPPDLAPAVAKATKIPSC